MSGDVAASTQIELRHGEELDARAGVSLANRHVQSDRLQTDVVITAGAPLTWEPRFTYKGFRFVQVDGLSDRAAVRLRAQVAHNDVAEVSRFTCSDPVLTWIDAALRRTVLNNLHHIPTDAPTFEKNGWTGDVHVAAAAMLGQFDLRRLFVKWLDDMIDSMQVDGGLPVIVPSPGWGCGCAHRSGRPCTRHWCGGCRTGTTRPRWVTPRSRQRCPPRHMRTMPRRAHSVPPGSRMTICSR